MEIYKCKKCEKNYSSYNTLWKHNKIYHDSNKIVKNIITEIIDNKFICIVCKKNYSHKQSLHKHEKTCVSMKEHSIELEVENTKLERTKIEQENKIIDLEALKLQIKLQGMKSMDKKTFKYINKMLMDRRTQNITQNITNNYQIMALGKENLVNNLSRNEKKMILDSRHNSIDKMIEIVHCGTHNMFNNIVITNLKDKFAYRYDETKGYFITENKSDLLDNLIMFRMMDLETIYDELSTENKIDNKTKKIIQEFLDKMENEEPFIYDTVEYPNFKSYKMNNIKILLYNNQDQITKEIALLIGDNKIPIE